MTGTFILSGTLFLLATFVWYTNAETPWSTESNAEEEEENKQNILFGNESLKSTFPFESTSTERNLIDKLNAVGDNSLWMKSLNLSEYDDLHDESKHDASPENSVDRDSLDNVNNFLQDKPSTVSPQLELKDNSPSPPKGVLLNNDTTSSSTEILNRNDVVSLLLNNHTISRATTNSNQNSEAPFTGLLCAFGDRKCHSQVSHTDVLKGKDKMTSTTSGGLSFWNAVKTSTTNELLPSGVSDTYSSVIEPPDYVSITITPSETSTAQTSENIILIDGREVNKDDSVIQNQPNKSDKSKPSKHDGSEELSDDRTLLKSSLPPSSVPTKDTFGMRLSISGITTRTFEVSSALAPDEGLRIESSVVPGVSEGPKRPIKTEINLPESTYIIKVGENSTLEYSKQSQQLSTPSLNYHENPTVSWYNAKSNVQSPNTDNPSKLYTADVTYSAPLLTPSFQETLLSIETRSVELIPSSFSETMSTTSSIQISHSSTPLLETLFTSPHTTKDDVALPAVKEVAAPPPRITNPSCSSLPVCVEITLLETPWEQFCSQTFEFQEFLSKSVSHYLRPVSPLHIVLDAEICTKSSTVRPLQSSPDVTVAFYVIDDSGEYEERLTEIAGVVLRKWAPTSFRSSIIEVRMYNSEAQSTALPIIPELNSGFVAAVSISAVAGVALCLLCILLVVMKQKMLQGRNSDTTTPTADAYSLDSLSINASFRRRRNRRSARSYLNHAFNDQEIPSHPLNEKTLSNCLKSRDLLEEEFRKIPMNMPKLDSIPEGAHVKNRYSNILPKPETRVVLAEPSGDPFKCYINANFIKGYEGKSAFYIACQAPLPEGIEDFWRMIWEQQSRTIVMLTMFEENGTSRCAMYFPQSTLVSLPPFGDFQISLLKKEVYEFYTMSTLRLLDLEKNLFRDIIHLWFTGWPDVGVPKDPSSLITFVQQCRPYINSNAGPTIVHCSTGTGRTGVFLALDICMREYEESRSIDILQCISQLRRDRGGAVQNKDQYILIYEAMLEYISRVENQSNCPSVCSKNS